MTFAIGDIHGSNTALKTMLETLNLSPSDLLICLGDYVDRGPDSKGVVDTLLEYRKTHQLVHLRGNHEIQMMNGRTGKKGLDFFLQSGVGGQETLASYGCSIDEISDEHWNFLMTESKIIHETDTHIFVHGGVDPDRPISEQTVETFCWDRFYNKRPHCSGKTVVCGHTIQGDTPNHYDYHSICIDTCAYGGGWLTALNVETNHYFQTNERGQVREGDL